MRQQFELFVRCLGLALVVGAILLGIRDVALWLLPVPDLGGFGRSVEELIAKDDPRAAAFLPWKDLAQLQTRAFVVNLITLSIVPGALGLLCLRHASAIAARCVPVERRATEPPASPAGHETSGSASPGQPARPGVEHPDEKYAPPGYLR